MMSPDPAKCAEKVASKEASKETVKINLFGSIEKLFQTKLKDITQLK